MSLPTVMTDRFRAAADVSVQRSSFDRSHGYKTTFDAGWLIPIFVDEALPGDTFNVSMTAFARLATPLKPVMDNMHLETFFFAVPIRLLWEHWEAFCGAVDPPGAPTEYLVPQVNYQLIGITEGSLEDYFGLPTRWSPGNSDYVCAFWHRAYNLIWNEWFRDQNLQAEVTVNTDDGPDSPSDYTLLRRGKRHDYFTSCLPWPQKGADVLLPLGDTAPVVTNSLVPSFNNATDTFFLKNLAGFDYIRSSISAPTATGNLRFDAVTGLETDLSSATAASINDIREAFQLQKILERDARGGTRYTEIIKSHFGVNSPDQRLQRPEFLGGGRSPVDVVPVAQTSDTDPAVSPQGNLAAFGTVSARGHGFAKSFTEHCVLIGLANVRADLTYQDGLHRMWSRSTRYDFYWPALAHLGEQAVLTKEIYSNATATDEDVFGYQERFAEYRYKPSQITGAFRSNYSVGSGSLDAWHLSEEFSSVPLLNAAFIQSDPPIDRVIAVATEPHFLFDAYFKMRCARPMPVYSIPGFVDHF